MAPQAMPRLTEVSVAINPTISEMRPPIRQRTSRSRPDSSVPNQCMFLSIGPWLMASQSVESNALGSNIGPKMQASVIRLSSTTLKTAARLRMKRTRAAYQRLWPWMSASSAWLSVATRASFLFLNIMVCLAQ